MACREQTAGHNALLLFVHLALTMMEGRLDNAFKDLTAKKAEVSITLAARQAQACRTLEEVQPSTEQSTVTCLRSPTQQERLKSTRAMFIRLSNQQAYKSDICTRNTGGAHGNGGQGRGQGA